MRNECGAVSLAKTINNFLLFLNFFVPAWANKKRPTSCGSSSGTTLLYKVPSKSTGKNFVTNVY